MMQKRLTKRSPDGWDSARFLSFFGDFGSFPFPNLFLPSLRQRKPLGASNQMMQVFKMHRTGKTLLVIGAGLNFVIALIHVGIVVIGAPAYLYFGTTELARLAGQGSPVPATVTLILAGVFAIFAGYALAGAGLIHRLPLLRSGLLSIAGLYILRGLIVVLDLIRLVRGAGYPFRQTVFSAVALLIGLVYFLGTFQQWENLRPKAKFS